MPFTWSYIKDHGFLIGNREKGSQMQVANKYNFSYPGYSENFCGWPDDSVDSNEDKGKAMKDAKKLYKYLNENKAGLLPYQSRGVAIPDPQKGMIHKDMGVQENQNCTLITMRMKHRRMRWGRGANNLAKVMYRKENRELISTIDRYTNGLITTIYLGEIIEEISAAKAPKKDGKGNPYLDRWNAHMPLLDAMRTASRKAFTRAFIG